MDRAPEQASARGADNRPDGPVAPAVEFAAEKRTRGRADDEPGRPIVAAAVITDVVAAPAAIVARQAQRLLIEALAVIASASRERMTTVSGKRVTGRVNTGGAGNIKKKT